MDTEKSATVKTGSRRTRKRVQAIPQPTGALVLQRLKSAEVAVAGDGSCLTWSFVCGLGHLEHGGIYKWPTAKDLALDTELRLMIYHYARENNFTTKPRCLECPVYDKQGRLTTQSEMLDAEDHVLALVVHYQVGCIVWTKNKLDQTTFKHKLVMPDP